MAGRRTPRARLSCNKPSGVPFACLSVSTDSMTLRVLALVLATATLAACSGSQPAPASAQEAYQRGQEAFENRKYDRAIELMRATLDFGRTTEFADDAQLTLARAYRADKQYLLAGAEYTRFVDFYRTDPRVEQAAYERIQAYAELSPTYELDQTDTEQTIVYIRLFLQQFGTTSDYASSVGELLDELQEKLARKMYEGGRLYERRGLYEAAAINYGRVLETYPASEYADDAAVGRIRAQADYAEQSIPSKQAERYRTALQHYDQFVTLFPASPFVADAEVQYDRAYRGLVAAGGSVTDGASGAEQVSN